MGPFLQVASGNDGTGWQAHEAKLAWQWCEEHVQDDLNINKFPDYSCFPPDPAPYLRTENALSNNTGFFSSLTMQYI